MDTSAKLAQSEWLPEVLWELLGESLVLSYGGVGKTWDQKVELQRDAMPI